MLQTGIEAVDELAIRNLIARYAYHADAGEMEQFAALFIEDGSWTRENSPPSSQGGSGLPAQTFTGNAALRVLIENSIIKTFNRRVRHQMTDVLVEPSIAQDQAHARFRALITDWRDGNGRIAMCGTYSAHCVRTESGWKFAAISLRVLPE